MVRLVTPRWWLKWAIVSLVWSAVLLGVVNPRAARAAAAPVITLHAFVAAQRYVRLPDGINLAYVQMGNPAGMPVVLIHGYTDSAIDWVPMLPYLPRNWRLIIPDLRGFGSSSKPGCCYDLVDFAYDIKLLLDQLHVRRADIVGFSLGSMVAQRLAETWPRRVRRAVLISSTGGTHECRAPVELHQFDCGMPVIRAMKKTPAENSPFMIEWFGAPRPGDRQLMRMERRDAAALPLSSWRTVLEQALTHPRLGVFLPRLNAPALLIWGSEDPIMSPEDRASLETALPHAAVHVFAGLGHDVIWERPRRVASVIARFLDRRASAGSPGLP